MEEDRKGRKKKEDIKKGSRQEREENRCFTLGFALCHLTNLVDFIFFNFFFNFAIRRARLDPN